MPHNPEMSRPVVGYVKLDTKRRIAKIRKAKPRYTESFQINQALERHLPTLEAECGFKPAR